MKKIMDKFGICVSSLCLIHCLLTPVFIILFPSLTSTIIVDESLHIIFAVLVIFSVIIAVYPQCRRHGHKDIIAYALAGISLIVLSFVLEDTLGHEGHIGLSILGSISLIIAHIRNIKVRHGKCEPVHKHSSSCKHS